MACATPKIRGLEEIPVKERTEILEETFRKLVEEKKFSSLRDLMATMYPADVASILSDLPKDMLPALTHSIFEKFPVGRTPI